MKKSYPINLGNKEGILSAEDAEKLIQSRLTFVPKADKGTQIDGGLVSLYDNYFPKSDVKVPQSDKIATLAHTVVQQLGGVDERFNKFTAESLMTIDKDMFTTLVDAGLNTDGRSADRVDQAIQGVPAANGKTFTSVQTLRIGESLSNDFPKLAQHFHDVRLPLSWGKDDRPTVTPRGTKSAEVLLQTGLGNNVLSQSETQELMSTMLEGVNTVVGHLEDDNMEAAQDEAKNVLKAMKGQSFPDNAVEVGESVRASIVQLRQNMISKDEIQRNLEGSLNSLSSYVAANEQPEIDLNDEDFEDLGAVPLVQ